VTEPTRHGAANYLTGRKDVTQLALSASTKAAQSGHKKAESLAISKAYGKPPGIYAPCQGDALPLS
jgi:hypothetical protein